MRSKRLSITIIKYEIRNIAGNPFTIFFGICFPILMSFIITRGLTSQVPESMRQNVNTSVFITMSMIIPMAIFLIGYAVTYALEIEKDIPLRMNLFGFSEQTLLAAKLIANLLVMSVALVIYAVCDSLFMNLLKPRLCSAICLIVALYLIGIILFILSHALAMIFRKFGTTYAVTMLLYFGIMILCGMMGIKTEILPGFLKAIATTLPMSYISSDFIDFWENGTYNFAPLIQSFLFFGAVSTIILLYAIHKSKRRLK